MKKILVFCLLFTIVFTAKAQNLIPFYSKDKIGFKNDVGEIIVPAYYTYPDSFPDGLLEIRLNDKYGFIDKTGKIIIPCKYVEVNSFSNGLALARESFDSYYGYIDKTGKTSIPFKFRSGSGFHKGRAVVLLDDTVWIIDLTGKEIKELKYTRLGWSKDDITNVGLNGKYGRIYIATGEEIIPPIYESMLRFVYQFGFISRVQLNNKWGVIDKLGNVIVPIEYDEVYCGLGGIIEVTKNEEDFYFDMMGKKIEKEHFWNLTIEDKK